MASTPTIRVRYWAAARAAAGVAEEVLDAWEAMNVDDVVRRVLTAHPGAGMKQVIGVCSVLVGDRPTGARDHREVPVEPGQTVEFLPPYAGG